VVNETLPPETGLPPLILSFVPQAEVLFSKSEVELMKVADLTVEELQALIKKTLHEELQELLADPDAGYELTKEIEARLASSLQSTERVSFEEVKKRYNLR
jgi:signal recognition particle GTPase